MFMHAVLLALDRVYPAWLCRDGSSGTDALCEDPDGTDERVYGLPDMDWRSVQVLTSLMTFFIVFYGNQSYTRFMQFWDFCVSLGGLTMDWATLVRTHLPDEPTVQWNVTRLPLAAMHLMFYELHSTADDVNGLRRGFNALAIDESEWEIIAERELLTSEEAQIVKSYQGYTAHLPLVWAARAVQEVLREEEAKPPASRVALVTDPHIMQGFRDLAQGFRRNCTAITNQLKQPVPLPYFHMLQVRLHAQLPPSAFCLLPPELYFLIPRRCCSSSICSLSLGDWSRCASMLCLRPPCTLCSPSSSSACALWRFRWRPPLAMIQSTLTTSASCGRRTRTPPAS